MCQAIHEWKSPSLPVCAVPGSHRYTPAFAAAAERISNDFTAQSQPISALINCLQQCAIPFMMIPNTPMEHLPGVTDPSVAARAAHQRREPAAQAAESTALLFTGPTLQQQGSEKGGRNLIFEHQTICHLPGNVTSKEVDSSSSVTWLLVEALELLLTCY